ncbi:hypothetical protein F5I97DRAFT_1924065 [Phlebopus sp. FC_14]|nr:hypothetical protein F5I97DRAFT_1924065 [Phlebopus sp. FC_14]
MHSAERSPTPVEPRPSASLIIINDRNEVLLVQRNPQARSFAGIHVFPGGNFDSAQDSSLAITAIRETFEESGLLIASFDSRSNCPHTLDSDTLDDARKAVHEQKLDFQSFLSDKNLKCDQSLLHPFTTWITPPTVARRFRTQFYVTFLSESVQPGFSSGHKENRLPSPDGGQEVVSARFIRPDIAISEFVAHRIGLMPPQYYVLATLSELLHGDTTTPEQRDKLILLSNGAFGKLTINPTIRNLPSSDWELFIYEGDELRRGPRGRLHRASVKRNGAVFTQIELQRNFDIFTDDVSVSSTNAKL